MRGLVLSLLLTGCAWFDPSCWEVASSSLAGGTASLTTAGGTLQPTTFVWTGGRPEEDTSSFEFDFGDAKLACTTAKLKQLHGRVLLSSLEAVFTNQSPCQIVVGTESIDWTGGSITVSKRDGETYDVRLDSAATEVSDVTIALDGLTGTATFEAVTCTGGGGWWL
jgi:hypothetical protein